MVLDCLGQTNEIRDKEAEGYIISYYKLLIMMMMMMMLRYPLVARHQMILMDNLRQEFLWWFWSSKIEALVCIMGSWFADSDYSFWAQHTLMWMIKKRVLFLLYFPFSMECRKLVRMENKQNHKINIYCNHRWQQCGRIFVFYFI